MRNGSKTKINFRNLFLGEKGEYVNKYDYSKLIRGDRVRSHSPPEINQTIDSEIAANKVLCR
jgi:hypothetical protein